ncbi:hypothetical protein BC360_25760 [Ensifer sp. LC163]|nr:hypothetical protein BC360_25760 [Ensifer sp. LC163]
MVCKPCQQPLGVLFKAGAGGLIFLDQLRSTRYLHSELVEGLDRRRARQQVGLLDGRDKWGDEGYAKEELVAELGSVFLSADLGLAIEPREDHAAYIASWLKLCSPRHNFSYPQQLIM